MIRLDYFKQFGDTNTLLEIVKINENIGSAKQISKDKIVKLGMDESIIKKYGNETEKMYTKIQADKIVSEMILNIKFKQFSLKDKLDAQQEILGSSLVGFTPRILTSPSIVERRVLSFFNVSSRYEPYLSSQDQLMTALQ